MLLIVSFQCLGLVNQLCNKISLFVNGKIVVSHLVHHTYHIHEFSLYDIDTTHLLQVREITHPTP